MATRTSIYGQTRLRMFRSLSGRVSGSENCLFLALCTHAMSDNARIALVKSAESMGYGPDGATFLDVESPAPLSPNELFAAIEGLDPLCIVVASEQASVLFAQAYHVTLPPHASARVFGREVRLLPNLDDLVETPAGKQRAWAALKTLPHLQQ